MSSSTRPSIPLPSASPLSPAPPPPLPPRYARDDAAALAGLLDFLVQIPTDSGERRQEDGTPEGKTRGEVVDALCAALEKDGFRPVRDRNAMRPGDRISDFIRELTRANLVLAVISDKYLRSSYCMHEIHGLWQRSQEDAALMAERLVPIILPEVKIRGLVERAPYVKHWRKQHEELQELQRELGPDLSPESQREVRLVRDFAQDVDGILIFLQDILMPRNVEAHFEDGFQAVLEALRRRRK